MSEFVLNSQLSIIKGYMIISFTENRRVRQLDAESSSLINESIC